MYLRHTTHRIDSGVAGMPDAKGRISFSVPLHRELLHYREPEIVMLKVVCKRSLGAVRGSERSPTEVRSRPGTNTAICCSVRAPVAHASRVGYYLPHRIIQPAVLGGA